MKKLFLMLSVALMAIACSKSNEPAKTGIKLTSDPIVNVPETGILSVTFDAYEKWTAELVFDEGDEPFAQLSTSKGEAAEGVKLNVTFDDLPDGCSGRGASLVITTSTSMDAVMMFQGKVFEAYAIDDVDVVGVEGGSIVYQIVTNCEYQMKKYDGADQSFPWAPVSFDEDKLLLSFDVNENPGYDSRQAYVKFTIPEIQVPDGEGGFEDKVVRLYASQEGRLSLSWERNLTDISDSFAPGAIVRLANSGDELVISDGGETGTLHQLYNYDGSDKGAVYTYKNIVSLTSDDAGHLVFAGTGVYDDTEPYDSLTVTAVINNQYTELGKMVNNNVYSSTFGNLRVTGDVTTSACITALTDVYVYCLWNHVSSGKFTDEYGFFALPSNGEIMNWNSERNGCVVPLGPSISDGTLYMGYDGLYTLYKVPSFGNPVPLFSYDAQFGEGAGSNVNFQAISVAKWNNKTYAAVLASTYFSWGEVPAVFLFNVTDQQLVSYAPAANLGVEYEYVGANDGGNASADVLLIPGETLGVVVADVLNNVIYRYDLPALN